MTNSEIRQWAKEKIKGKVWQIFLVAVVAGILTGLSFTIRKDNGDVNQVISLGWLFYFVEVGFTYYMIKFITDQNAEFNDIFHFSSDFGRDLVVGLLQTIFVFLWTLLFIIPGIIKLFSYVMVPYLLADDKYKDLGYMDILRKSEEMMKGHRMDYFLLNLSFIGWHILAIMFTFGLLEIWIIPYQTTAATKFIYDLKSSEEK